MSAYNKFNNGSFLFDNYPTKKALNEINGENKIVENQAGKGNV
jgi:hypothetical protein